MTRSGRGARPTEAEHDAYLEALPGRWGKGQGMPFLAPSVGNPEWGSAFLSRLQLHSCTPAAWAAFATMAFDIDVRHVVPSIDVPTLVDPRER